jgi:hypothetical protein
MHVHLATWVSILGAIGLAGLLLGLLISNILTILALSTVLAIAAIIASVLTNLSVGFGVLAVSCCLIALQWCYLAGLLLSGFRERKAKSHLRHLRIHHDT